jgi:hypothetical protein
VSSLARGGRFSRRACAPAPEAFVLEPEIELTLPDLIDPVDWSGIVRLSGDVPYRTSDDHGTDLAPDNPSGQVGGAQG